MAIPLMLLSSSGPLDADPQTSAWLDTFRNAGLPLFVIGYALRRRYEVASGRSHTGTPTDVIWAAAGTVAVVCFLSLLASPGHQLLPQLMLGDSYASAMVAGNVVVCLLCLAAAAVLVSRPPYSILDLWLMGVVLAWMYAAALRVSTMRPSTAIFTRGITVTRRTRRATPS
jgi:two-component system sensor histidine kinase UhpB